MPTTLPRRCSLRRTTAGVTPKVRAVTDNITGPYVVVALGDDVLMLDMETASELAEALRVAVIELVAAAEAVTA